MITWYPQEYRTSCVAACIRIVLSDFNQFTTEKAIRQVLGNPRFGLSLDQAYQHMIRYGVDADFHDNWGLIDLRDCLKAGCYPVVGIDRQFLGHLESPHAIVLIEVGSHTIRAFDPLGTSSPETIRVETFELAWVSTGQEALVIKSPFPQGLL
jgi:ABC-type bacteriocin/lantibiotic exporter with double-glycine peptidase domain